MFEIGPSMPGQKRMNSVPGAAAVDPDTSLSKPKEVVLEVEADGWPRPTYQWYKGKQPIPGATEPKLVLSLKPMPRMVLDQAKNNELKGSSTKLFYKEQLRFYRCVRCKQINKEVPYVAYHVVCGNCKKPFIHAEIEPYDDDIQEIDDAILLIKMERQKLIEARNLLKSMLEGNQELDTSRRMQEEKLVRTNTLTTERLEDLDPRDPLFVKLKYKKQAEELKEQLILFEDLSNQIREKNAGLLNLQEEKLGLKTKLDHAYRFYDEGEFKE